MDHHSLEKPPRRQNRHRRVNGNYMHLGDTNLREELENEPHNKKDHGENVPGNTFEMGVGTPYCLAPDEGNAPKWV